MKKKFVAIEHEGMFWVNIKWCNAKKQTIEYMYCSTISMGRARKIARALNMLEKKIQKQKRQRKLVKKVLYFQCGCG